MKKYTFEDVHEAAISIARYVNTRLDAHPVTNQLMVELAELDYKPTDFESAKELRHKLVEIERKHHKMIMTQLKPQGKNPDWPGMYIIHDLICVMAHFGFVLRYAIKDTERTEENAS